MNPELNQGSYDNLFEQHVSLHDHGDALRAVAMQGAMRNWEKLSMR